MTSQLLQIEKSSARHVRIGGAIHTAALIPVRIQSPNRFIPELVEHQTEIVLENLTYILDTENLSRNDVVSCRLYTVSIKRLLPRIDRIYHRFFEGGDLPLRTEIGVTELARGALVAMEFVAVAQ